MSLACLRFLGVLELEPADEAKEDAANESPAGDIGTGPGLLRRVDMVLELSTLLVDDYTVIVKGSVRGLGGQGITKRERETKRWQRENSRDKMSGLSSLDRYGSRLGKVLAVTVTPSCGSLVWPCTRPVFVRFGLASFRHHPGTCPADPLLSHAHTLHHHPSILEPGGGRPHKQSQADVTRPPLITTHHVRG